MVSSSNWSFATADFLFLRHQHSFENCSCRNKSQWDRKCLLVSTAHSAAQTCAKFADTSPNQPFPLRRQLRSLQHPPSPMLPRSPRSVRPFAATKSLLFPPRRADLLTIIALLCMQGREVKTRRVHALLQRRRPGKRLPIDHRPVPILHEGVRLRSMTAAPAWEDYTVYNNRAQVYSRYGRSLIEARRFRPENCDGAITID